MPELRNKNTCFQAKPSEAEKINAVAKSLNMNKSEYIKSVVMPDVEKRYKKLKG